MSSGYGRSNGVFGIQSASFFSEFFAIITIIFRPPCFHLKQAAFSSKAGITPAHSNSFNFRTTPRFLRHNHLTSNRVVEVVVDIINTRLVEAAVVVEEVAPLMIGNSQSSVATAIPVRHLMGASMLSNSNRHTETSNRQAHSNPNIHKPLPPLLNSITASITMVEAALNNSNRDRIGLRLTPEVA